MEFLEFKSMPLEKRVYLLEQIWESIKDEEDNLPSPTWHNEILKERKELYKKGKVESFSTKEIKDMLG